MYEELVTALRYCATHPCMGEGQAIAHCKAVWAEDDRFDDCGSCNAVLQMQAADAIDKQNVIISGLNETIKMYENETPQWIPVTERKTGEWCADYDYAEYDFDGSTPLPEPRKFQDGWQCSLCGGYSPSETNFCPNCGAKMMVEPPKEE